MGDKKNTTANILMIGLATRFLLQQSKINIKKDTTFDKKTTFSEPTSPYSTILNTVKKDTVSEIKDNYKSVKTNFINRFLNVLHLKPSPREDKTTSEEEGDNDNDFNNRYNTYKSTSKSTYKSTSSPYKSKNINITNNDNDSDSDSEEGDNDIGFNNTSKSTSSPYKPRNINVTNNDDGDNGFNNRYKPRNINVTNNGTHYS